MPQRHSLYRDRPTKANKLFAILGDAAGHSTTELVRRIGHAFGGAIFKLRRLGYVIDRQKHPTKRYQSLYRLREKPTD